MRTCGPLTKFTTAPEYTRKKTHLVKVIDLADSASTTPPPSPSHRSTASAGYSGSQHGQSRPWSKFSNSKNSWMSRFFNHGSGGSKKSTNKMNNVVGLVKDKVSSTPFTVATSAKMTLPQSLYHYRRQTSVNWRLIQDLDTSIASAPASSQKSRKEVCIPRQRKSKRQRNKMTRLQVGANNGPRRTLANQKFKAPQKQSCNWPNCKYFGNKSNLVVHQRTHTGVKPFKCTWPNCGKSFSRSTNRTTHRRTHTGEKQFKCTWPKCGKSFKVSSNRTVHRRTHTGVNPFKCTWPKCGKSFKVSSNRTVHRRTHTGVKPFSCNWPNCDNSFTTCTSLKVHRRMHTGDRPFKCEICDYRCAHSSNLSSHMRSHTGEKPYKCRVCPATFAHSSNKVQHEKIHRKKSLRN